MGPVRNEDPSGQFRIGAELRAAVLVLDPGRPCNELGDAPRDAVGAYNGREDKDVVTDPDGPVGPSIAHDCHIFTSWSADVLGHPVQMPPAGVRYYTIFKEFHQPDVKKRLPFRLEP
jgi:hypothetical protein